MAELHIEEFYRDCACILLQLYASFPRKGTVFVEDICGPDAPDEYGVHSKRHQACFGAMLWLEEEGFLRFQDTIRQEAIDQACLTQQAFRRLSAVQVDDSGVPSRTRAQALIDLLHHASSSVLAEAMARLLLEADPGSRH